MSNTFTQAHYTKQSDPAFKGNPFIEALPPFRTSDEFLDILKNYPEVPEYCEAQSKEERMQRTWTTLSFFQPLSTHADIAQAVDTMIRLGLVPRNLPDKDAYFWKDVNETKRLMAQNLALLPSPLTSSTSIIGASGMGKTTAITRIISQYPSVIEHPIERVGDAGRIQLVWLYLNCTTTKSIGALCGHFFKEIDRLFGLNSEEKGSHYWKYGRAQKVDALMDNVAHVAAMYRLGVLVIDELQFLSTVGVSMEQVMNYLTRLSNVAKVPIVYVGTYKVLKILMHEFRQARRSSGQGDFLWPPMEQYELDDQKQLLLDGQGNRIADHEWEHFVSTLWHYQYLTAKTPLTPELSNALYEESQGITDFAVKLYLLAQVRAIATGKEKLTPALIKQVAKDSIRLVAPFLKKLRLNSCIYA